MLIIARVLKEKWLENDGFCSFTNNKQTWEWSCQRFRQVSGQDRKVTLALGTDQIAGFGGFRPPESLEKNKCTYSADTGISEKTRCGPHSIVNPWIFLYFTLYKCAYVAEQSSWQIFIKLKKLSSFVYSLQSSESFLVGHRHVQISGSSREEVASQIITVIENISKVTIRFDWLEDRTSILSQTYDMKDTWGQAVQSPRFSERRI